MGVELSTQDLKRKLYYGAEQRADANLKTLETLETGERSKMGAFMATSRLGFLLPPATCMSVAKVVVLVSSPVPIHQH